MFGPRFDLHAAASDSFGQKIVSNYVPTAANSTKEPRLCVHLPLEVKPKDELPIEMA